MCVPIVFESEWFSTLNNTPQWENKKGNIHCLKKWKKEVFSEVLFLVSFQTLQPQAEKMKQDSVEEQRVNRIILLKYTPSNSVKRKVNKRKFLTVKIFLCT